MLIFQGGFHKLIIWVEFLWYGVTWYASMFLRFSVSIGGLHKLRVCIKALWFSHLSRCWTGVAMDVAFCRFSLYPCGLHKLRVYIKALFFYYYFLYVLILVSSSFSSTTTMLLVVDFMSVQNISKPDFSREVLVGDIGG